LAGKLHVADADLNVSFHNSLASPLRVAVKQWVTAGHGQSALSEQERIICRFWPSAARYARNADDLRNELAAGVSELIRCCRFSLGDHQFGFDFGHVQLTVRSGGLHDLLFGCRVFLREIRGMEDFALALRGPEKLAKRTP